MWMDILWAFVIGGAICAVAQVAMDATPFTVSNGHVLVTVLLIGEVLGFFGLYDPFVDFAGMGAAIPISGFGNTLVQGTFEAIAEDGWLGIFTGGFMAGAAGLAAAVVFGFLAALIFKPKG